ncbi:BspA family leucine-rich repeat surface protein [Photobacterium leiognathi]|uniref:BspA family leucine-rich repeat surface protein n=1 Tax=Photobacterium leiognathi TaxID=553611 RepID=UPI00273951E6|nr:BspA family leucine-rich repeat surface protein [Photobacterium leiognathi]
MLGIRPLFLFMVTLLAGCNHNDSSNDSNQDEQNPNIEVIEEESVQVIEEEPFQINILTVDANTAIRQVVQQALLDGDIALIESLDTSQVTDMSGLFAGTIFSGTIDLTAWDTSNVTICQRCSRMPNT